MHFQAGIDWTKGGVPHVVNSQSCTSHNHDFVFECSLGKLPMEYIADRVMREGSGWTEVVDEYFAHFISGYKPFPHLYAFYPVNCDFYHKLWPI